MPTQRLHVDVFVFPNAMLGLALTVVDMLRLVNTIARLQKATQPLPVSWRLLDANALPVSSSDPVLAPYCGDTCPPATTGPELTTVCLVPSLYANNVPDLRSATDALPAIKAKVGQCLRDGQMVAILGNGAWLAAASHQLAGRSLALPWMYVSGFQRDYPDVILRSDMDCIEDGPVISGSVPAAVSAVVMAMLRRALSAELMQVCINVFQHDPERHEMAIASNQQNQIPVTRDGALARAVVWLNDHLEQPYSLSAVAIAARVSSRTLLRHFQQVMGMTPLDYLHRQRCKRARILLEVTLDSVPTVARACGYTDPAAFRRIFLRVEKVTPTRYRASHALRASRSRWQVEAVEA